MLARTALPQQSFTSFARCEWTHHPALPFLTQLLWWSWSLEIPPFLYTSVLVSRFGGFGVFHGRTGWMDERNGEGLGTEIRLLETLIGLSCGR